MTVAVLFYSQEMLEKRETVTLCSYLTKEIFDDISLKAHLQFIKLRDEPEQASEEELFTNENPGVCIYFYHMMTCLGVIPCALKTIFH